MKRLKIIASDSFYIFMLEHKEITFFSEGTETFSQIKLNSYLQKITPGSEAKKDLFKAVLRLKVVPGQVLTIEENGKWLKEINNEQYEQIKRGTVPGSPSSLKLIVSDTEIIFEVNRSGKTGYFREKYSYPELTRHLKIYLEKIGYLPLEVPEALLKAIARMPENKGRVLTIHDSGKWFKETDTEGYNRLYNSFYTAAPEINPGETKNRQGVSELIIDELLKLTEKNPGDDQAFNKLGVAYTGLKRYEDAVDVLREAISINHENEEYFINLGRAYYLSGRYDLAAAEFKEALSLNKENFMTYFELGNAFYDGKKLHEAIAPYHNAIVLNPEYVPAYMKLGILYNELEYPDEAIFTFQTVLYLDPENEEALVKMGVSEYIKKKLMATEYNNLGIAYAERGKIEKAIEKFRLSLEINPNDFEVHYNLAMAYLNSKETVKAIAALKEAINLKNDFAEARGELAEIYRKQGDYRQAIKEYTEYLKLEKEPDKIKKIQEIINSLSV